MEKLLDTALSAFMANSSDDHKYVVHNIIASYIAYIHEFEDMPSLKSLNINNMLVIDVEQKKINFHSSKGCERRSLAHTIEILSLLESDTSLKELPLLYSVSPIRHGLASFYIMSLQPCVDIHNIFCFEPLHSLSLSTSKLLKDCLVGLLEDDSKFSGAITTIK